MGRVSKQVVSGHHPQPDNTFLLHNTSKFVQIVFEETVLLYYIFLWKLNWKSNRNGLSAPFSSQQWRMLLPRCFARAKVNSAMRGWSWRDREALKKIEHQMRRKWILRENSFLILFYFLIIAKLTEGEFRAHATPTVMKKLKFQFLFCNSVQGQFIFMERNMW